MSRTSSSRKDYGETWKSLRSNLPTGSTRVLREDIDQREPALSRNRVCRLCVDRPGATLDEDQQQSADGGGTGVCAASDRGRTGRGDARPQPVGAGRDAAAADDERRRKGESVPVQANDLIRWRSEARTARLRGRQSAFRRRKPVVRAQIYYSLAAPAKKARIKVQDYAGRTVRELDAGTEPGLHRVEWNLMMEEQPTLLTLQRAARSGTSPPRPVCHRRADGGRRLVQAGAEDRAGPDDAQRRSSRPTRTTATKTRIGRRTIR